MTVAGNTTPRACHQKHHCKDGRSSQSFLSLPRARPDVSDKDPTQEVPRVAKQIVRRQSPSLPYPKAFVMRECMPSFLAYPPLTCHSVTEQPYKIPFYAALLRLLHDPAPSEAETVQASSSSLLPSLGKLVLEDFWKGFQSYLDKLAWRDIRLCIHFFAHLMVAQVISIESMSALLQSFAAVLDEFGVSYGRGKNAALCAAEGLLIAGPVIKKSSSPNTSEIIKAIQTFNESVISSQVLVQPIMSPDAALAENAEELLESGLAVLKALESSESLDGWNSVSQPYLDYPDLDPTVSSPFELPSILVPPEVIELDGLATDAGEDAQVKKEDWPEYFFRLFDTTVNRKECARLLLEYPKWCAPGTFKPRSEAPPTEEDPNAKNWQLESVVIETVLGSLFLLPEPPQKSIYYISLITELCKLSPSTVGPAVGKSIRKVYTSLGNGLDPEVSRRFVEWFVVHMSNFGFQWVWKEWVPDLALVEQHPKRTFMRRAIEVEVRLSYHDRILKTLPESMQSDPSVIAAQPPGPSFEYEDPSNPYYDAAQSILGLIRGRSHPEEVVSHVESLRTSLESTPSAPQPYESIDVLIRTITVQSLLSIGSRSFSHLLNAIERYLVLLRGLANPGPAQGGGDVMEAKMDILNAVFVFWKRNRQMIGIVFDKLMQYQIVDPTEVIAWTFRNSVSAISEDGAETSPLSVGAFEWDLIKGALDKANGRVMVARRKVAALRKEQDDSIARAMASGGADVASMEVDGEVKPIKQGTCFVLVSAVSPHPCRFSRASKKAALSGTIEGFVSCLAPSPGDVYQNPYAHSVIGDAAWEQRHTWSNNEWRTWETWGWYRHFCRTYAPYLRNYATTLSTVGFAKIYGSTDPAATLIKKTWDIATGQEA
ncbi:MIF4G like-domain-containing protein [Boletus reticuloceps]|uniref:MIF4G like-domain-containing protein n=1 Tax=Boletus reticuloceps TaxID=495285 RepID=A0A8I2YMZ4_9AGAM|nr:MIF4G like-domain-containing protein [Boletus reticuloceps]